LGSYITDISGSPLSQLSDATITTIASGELLKWNGSAWVNNTLAEAGISATGHTHTESDITDLGTYQVQLAEGAFVNGDKTKLDGIETGADVTDTANVTAAGALMDSEVDADIKTLSLPASTTISAFGATLVDDADAATARTTLGVDVAGTDNSTDVTLAGTGTYLSLAGQQITVDPITESDISDLDHDATKIQGVTVDNTDIANGKILQYNSTSGNLEYEALAGGGDMSTATYDPAGISQQVVGTTATQTLTNKTINTASNTITVVEADISDLGSYITASSSDTLTNKTIDGDNNTLVDVPDTAQNTTIAVRAYRSTDQTGIVTSTFTKVQLNAETFDVGADFDNATNYRFVPPVTGYYRVTGQIRFINVSANTRCLAAIYKAGTEVTRGEDWSPANNTSPVPKVTDLLHLTATTDYIELYGWHNSGTNEDINGASISTFLTVEFVGAA
jgi:hypothetical protein